MEKKKTEFPAFELRALENHLVPTAQQAAEALKKANQDITDCLLELLKHAAYKPGDRVYWRRGDRDNDHGVGIVASAHMLHPHTLQWVPATPEFVADYKFNQVFYRLHAVTSKGRAHKTQMVYFGWPLSEHCLTPLPDEQPTETP